MAGARTRAAIQGWQIKNVSAYPMRVLEDHNGDKMMKTISHIVGWISLAFLFNTANAQTLVPGSPCQVSSEQAAVLFDQFDRRLSSSGGEPSAASQVCKQINVVRVTIWVNQVCLGDPQFTSEQHSAIVQQIGIWAQNLKDLNLTYSQLTSVNSGGCECWSASHCPDG